MPQKKTPELPTGTQTQLLRMRQAIELFREHEREPSGIMIQVFLTIATAEAHSLTGSEIMKRLQISQASMSYNAARLLNSTELLKDRVGENRMGLIEMEQDPSDKRRFTFALTRQGRNLASALSEALSDRR